MHVIKLTGYLLIFSFILIGCSDSDDDTPITDALQVGNKRPLGTSANDLLSDTNFNSLTIEIVSVQGYEPTTTTITGFKQFLQERLFKPDGIIITQRTLPSSNKRPFTIDEIIEIENNTRTLFNQEDDITVYIYFADGSKEDDTNEKVTLGSAYLNTSIVIYENTLRKLSIKPNSPSLATIEIATLNHEFSHLLGLVNIGTALQSEHEDSDSKGHCNTPGCLMEAAIEFGGGMGIGNGVPKLDPQCIADLQANGGR
ncbi:hypothetical protein [Aquimarina sediminis]|uniref:hypothetical protein n=1 Tax=Aquimarina sediminis TaxID=2070536 RepID=UPI001F4DD32F|nr:hypothetical protein [Aquimarina sediminis]